MQSKIMRIINFKCLQDRVNMSEQYILANVLKINDIFEIKVAKFMHSFQNLKPYLSSYKNNV